MADRNDPWAGTPKSRRPEYAYKLTPLEKGFVVAATVLVALLWIGAIFSSGLLILVLPGLAMSLATFGFFRGMILAYGRPPFYDM